MHAAAGRSAFILGGTVGAFAMWWFARNHSGQRIARWTLLALLTTPLWFLGGQFANLDMLVAGCITATIVLLAHAVQKMEDGVSHHGALTAAYATAALGVLAKGLIGFVLPALVIAIWLLLRGRIASLLRLLISPGIGLFLLIAAPWFIAMQQRFPGFLHYFFIVQHFQRFTQSGFNNAQPFWFFPVALIVATLPISAWLYLACRRHYWQEISPSRLLMWVWLLMVLIFFSIPQSKLIGYILPAVPPLAFLAADAAALGGQRLRSRAIARWKAGLGIGALICIVLPPALAHYQPTASREFARIMEARRIPSEPLIYLYSYFYDTSFYARLDSLPLVVEDWSPWLRSTFRASKPRLCGALPPPKPWIIERLGAAGLRRLAQHHGYPQNKALLGVYGFKGDASDYTSRLSKWLDQASDGDLLMCHPSAPAAAANDIILTARIHEFNALSASTFSALLRHAQIDLQPLSAAIKTFAD